MNRLIIIGNGFDLAHKLNTKYSDFLSHYWSNVNGVYEDDLVQFNSRYNPEIFNSFDKIQARVDQINDSYTNVKIVFEIKNSFFRLLNEECIANNWVDIEMYYYHRLKKYLNNSNSINVKKLNDEFEAVKKAFEDYISNIVNDPKMLNLKYLAKMGKLFEPMKFSGRSAQEFIENLPYNLKNKINSSRMSNRDPYDIDNLHILNFNYTNTVNLYEKHIIKNRLYTLNHIHGEASNEKNKIVFGFGDEKDKLYNEIEDKNDNEYLRFMKSSAYLQTKNYSELLNFIEGGNFMVDIFGHSCGLSDRTLLNTIFEHKYCQFIRIHYHKHEVTETTINQPDNYTELVHNISRHFKDKTILREKVANKEISNPLPQFKEE